MPGMQTKQPILQATSSSRQRVRCFSSSFFLYIFLNTVETGQSITGLVARSGRTLLTPFTLEEKTERKY